MSKPRNLADAVRDAEKLVRALRENDPLKDVPRDWYIAMHKATYYQHVAPLLSPEERASGRCAGRALWLFDIDPFDGDMAFVSPLALLGLSALYNLDPPVEEESTDAH